ncbi:MAG: PQQ-dependent sugar dehydrogenase [Thermoleophilaceae bacterium]|nr:PQQ-dependent sugar dehydrogenase [Thermoleophilaceae bacterium]
MIRSILLGLAALTLGVGCGGSDEPASPPTTGSEVTEADRPADGRDEVEIEQTTIAEGLEVPWGLTFLPDGDALYTERDSGRLLRLDPESGESEAIQTLPTRGDGEGGALGLALSPDFEGDGLLYAYITTERDNRVVRFEIGAEPEPVLTGIPQNSFHDGGRIAFGPDGKLYVATGDAGDPDAAQDRGSLAGKILRVEPDGSVPRDNPIEDSPVYSLGHRNVEGLAWDEDDQLFASEFGENAFDEVNRIEAGGNFGWPLFEGDGGAEAENEGFINPITTWLTAEASPSGAAILIDGGIPQWEGDLFVAALRGERLWRVELARDGTVAGREPLLEGELGRIRNALAAPDGSLWVTTSNRDGRGSPRSGDDKIIRLGPAG